MKLSLRLSLNCRIPANSASLRTLPCKTSTAWLRRRLVKPQLRLASAKLACSYSPLTAPSAKRVLTSLQLYTKSLLVLNNKSRIQKARAKKLLAKKLLAEKLLAEKLRIKELFMRDPLYRGSWSLFTRLHLLFFTHDARPLWFLTQANLLSLFSTRLIHLNSLKYLSAQRRLGSSTFRAAQLTLLSTKL